MSASPIAVQSRSAPQQQAGTEAKTRVCFVGMTTLPALAREYGHYGVGGEQVQHALLAKALARRGYQVSMVTADYGQPDGAVWDGVKTYKAFAFNGGVPVLRFIHPRWSRLWSALRRADADVYYTSCAGAAVGQISMFCRQRGRKLIYRVASDSDCAPGELLVKYWRDKKLYEYGLRRADGVLAQSRQQQHLLEENFGIRSTLAGMLVEAGDAERTHGERDIPVLWINNFRPLKRPEIALELAAGLDELSFHMAGGPAPGNAQFYEQMKARATACSNVVFHGRVPYHDVGPLYERARVLVNTSDIEGFPNSYLQAWASGAPVVAFFDPDGLIEREGLGVAVRSPQQMADAVKMLATQPAAWAAASRRCRAFMAREYGADQVLSPYRAMIDALHEGLPS